MNLRKVKATDNATLAAIISSAFDDYDAPKRGTVYSDPTTDDLYTLFQTERSVLWVAEINGAIVGCCGVYPTPELPANYAELVKFYLNKTARGLGVGRALMEQCTQSAIELGYTHLYLESLPQFSNAVSIYEKQGYQLLDHPLGESGHTSCDIWMVKELG
ncbi:GNAT family N-acetyltransferase [Niabella yanshanensis]|uniref:GNAT family N-acetyltransferase n=1 Tax=Niabella yanshanensis TaxID=577386 RepID=A0ABZ0WCN4_9BACT|nr:GNAT family N-acetyltransferase [Niabella yanshanensis]WQD40633.1 GNAT family N-acetyltransferase [Niabella yanshanensis]